MILVLALAVGQEDASTLARELTNNFVRQPRGKIASRMFLETTTCNMIEHHQQYYFTKSLCHLFRACQKISYAEGSSSIQLKIHQPEVPVIESHGARGVHVVQLRWPCFFCESQTSKVVKVQKNPNLSTSCFAIFLLRCLFVNDS